MGSLGILRGVLLGQGVLAAGTVMWAWRLEVLAGMVVTLVGMFTGMAVLAG